MEAAGIKLQLKIGGMALENGVMFQTDRYWSMAVREAGGEIRIASGDKMNLGLSGMRKIPMLRGLVSLAESALVIPKASAHGGRLPIMSHSPEVMASMIVSVVGAIVVKNPKRKLPAFAAELVMAALAVLPSLVALRRSRAIEYHAAEHKSINAYEASGRVDAEKARQAEAEHPRCGSNIIGPAMALMTVGNTLAQRALGRRSNMARLGVSVLSLSGAVELVQWAARNPASLWSRALTRPGGELQHLVTTSEPTERELAVGLAALRELLRLEGALDTAPAESV
ncbi:MAG: DUF1385 domain-containing protein [Thermoleophilia bacterium]